MVIFEHVVQFSFLVRIRRLRKMQKDHQEESGKCQPVEQKLANENSIERTARRRSVAYKVHIQNVFDF